MLLPGTNPNQTIMKRLLLGSIIVTRLARLPTLACNIYLRWRFSCVIVEYVVMKANQYKTARVGRRQ
jgi:hypothetical protein